VLKRCRCAADIATSRPPPSLPLTNDHRHPRPRPPPPPPPPRPPLFRKGLYSAGVLDLPPFVLCEFTLPAQLPTQLLAATKDRTKAAPGGLSLGPVEAERSAGPRLSPGARKGCRGPGRRSRKRTSRASRRQRRGSATPERAQQTRGATRELGKVPLVRPFCHNHKHDISGEQRMRVYMNMHTAVSLSVSGPANMKCPLNPPGLFLLACWYRHRHGCPWRFRTVS